MRLIAFIFITFFLTPFFSNGQIVVFNNDKELNYKISNIKYIVQNGIQISDSNLNEVLQQKWNPYLKHNVKLENKEQTIWFKIPVKYSSQNPIDFLELKDPLINFVQIWIVRNEVVVKRFEKTGDHMPFLSRPIDYANFVFPLNEKDSYDFDIILATDKRHTTKSIPLYFYSENEYFSHIQSVNLIKGFLLGLVSILFFYNLYLSFIAKKAVYNWYSIYLFFILIYFLMDMGLLFQFVYPSYPSVNDVLRVGVISFSIIPFTFFFNNFLELHKNKPLFISVNNILLTIFFLTFILGICSSVFADFEKQQFWINIYNIISPLIIGVLTFESLYARHKKIPFSNFTAISLCGLISMVIIFSLHEKRILDDTIFTDNVINIGISFEIILMTFAIAYRFNLYKKEAEFLSSERNEMQQQMLQSMINYKEQNMQRLSNVLHDSVGAKISAIRLNMEHIIGLQNANIRDFKMSELTGEVSKLADEIRSLSHQLSPILLRKNGIVKSIFDLVSSINKANSIQIQLESLGSKNSLSFQYELMIYNILQELIQNMIKHSQATEGIIQLILEEDFISLFVEDNGVGFVEQENKDGLGFLHVKKMVAFTKGTLAIHAQPNKGCNISIEIKIKNNEEDN